MTEISTKRIAGLNRGIGQTSRQEKILDAAREALREIELRQIALMGD